MSIELRHVDLARGARRVLRDVTWRIRPGQRWLLQGANGAGKTQLLKLLAGDVWPQPRPRSRRVYGWRDGRGSAPFGFRQEIAYVGAERQDRHAHYGWNHRVSTVVGTGLQRSDAPLRALTADERTQVMRLLRRLRIEALARRRFLSLSQGEQRLVLLARALAWRPALLLLDEPLNGLDAPQRARLRGVLAGLCRTALPWVYATHRPGELPAGLTHRAVLAGGRLRTVRWRCSAARVIEPRRAGPRRLRTARARAPEADAHDRSALLELRNATVWRDSGPALRRVRLRIRRGECWAVHGPNGSGKSTLLGALHGEHGVDAAGAVFRAGSRAGVALQEFQRRVGRVSPELQAALPRRLTARELLVAAQRGAHALVGAPRAAEMRAARRALARCGAGALAPRPMVELSYGQARRVLFARALVGEPDILLLDEPYTGLDHATRSRLRALVDALVGEGCTVVIATHHRDDWPLRTTHELELAGGRVRHAGALRAPRAGDGT